MTQTAEPVGAERLKEHRHAGRFPGRARRAGRERRRAGTRGGAHSWARLDVNAIAEQIGSLVNERVQQHVGSLIEDGNRDV
jgi:hypothetical protein